MEGVQILFVEIKKLLLIKEFMLYRLFYPKIYPNKHKLKVELQDRVILEAINLQLFKNN
jgi:hypothetical protein